MTPTTMRLDCVCDPQLPKLAWLAILKLHAPVVKVFHGEWVEANTQFVFEGAWASDFAAVDFDRCETVVGSGIVLRDGRAVFCPASHTLSRLNVLRQGHMLFISNSFVFCMTAAGRRLRNDYSLYGRDFQSIVRGLGKQRTRTPLDKGVMTLWYVHNLVVRSDLQTELERKPSAPAFSCYEEYYAYLEKSVARIADNASSPARVVKYDPLATISSGYDSPACAVLAKAIGCTKALTFPEARESDISDSGTEIAKLLGYSTIEVDRLEYKRRTNYPEAEFVAAGTAADAGDVIFASLQDLVPKKLLITGHSGGGVWERKFSPKRALERGDASGSLLEEFRMRVGFVHLPVPSIGGLRGPELSIISRSPEMKAWALGTGYDRPLPRRIAEEAGIPRTWFGQHKKAAGARFFDGPNRGPKDLSAHLSPSSYTSYDQYFQENYRPNRYEIYYFVMNKLRRLVDKIYSIFNRSIGWRFGLPEFKPRVLRHYEAWIGKNWLLFHWAVEKTADRYVHSAKEVGNVLSSKPPGTRVS